VTIRRALYRTAAVAALLSGSVIALGSPASASAQKLTCSGPPTTQHSISIWCDGSLSGKSQFRVKAEFCSGTGCTWRYGQYASFNGGTSTARDNSIYFSGYYTLEYK
jgi:hypothetical protein